jgi:hypothetical protein
MPRIKKQKEAHFPYSSLSNFLQVYNERIIDLMEWKFLCRSFQRNQLFLLREANLRYDYSDVGWCVCMSVLAAFGCRQIWLVFTFLSQIWHTTPQFFIAMDSVSSYLFLFEEPNFILC